MREYDIAVCGATGIVGRKILQVLEERKIPVGKLYLTASEKSEGTKISFGGREYTVKTLDGNSFDEPVDIAFFATDSATALKYATLAAENGALVIDTTAAFRMYENVPVVIPEVNPSDAFSNSSIIANPISPVIHSLIALKPIHENYVIKRIVYSTYQAVSENGLRGITDLSAGVKGKSPSFYSTPIAFNCIPQTDTFMENGYTAEEYEMITETKKILGDEAIQVTATNVKVPVYFCDAVSINVETVKPFRMKDIFDMYFNDSDVTLVDDPAHNMYPTQLMATDTDNVYIGRIRRDDSCDNALNLWVVADNLRKGSASNAVQIAGMLIDNKYFDE